MKLFFKRITMTKIFAQPRTTKVLMFITSDFVNARYESLCIKAPQLDIVTELKNDFDTDISAIFTFHLPKGIASRLPQLRLAASVGAGADGILRAGDLSAEVQVTRGCDSKLGFSMAQFVVMQILRRFRDLPTLERQHLDAKWKNIAIPDASQYTVGIMGVGQTGSAVARAVAALGFRVVGWTRTSHRDVEIDRLCGKENLYAFLNKCDFLICLLPLTNDTRNILDKNALLKLRRGCFVVNVARGGILVEDDLLELVNNGYLSGAALDVFKSEPLDEDSAFWRHEKILVSPHIAAEPSVEPVVDQFIENLRRLEAGQPLLNAVNRKLGY